MALIPIKMLALSLVSLGQAAKAGSVPVAVASDQVVPVQSPTGTVVQTIVTGTSGVLIAANAARKSLRWMVTGAVDATVAPGTAPPSVGQGMIYQASAAGAGKQGASEGIIEGAMATNAFAFVAAAATSIVVWECS